MERTFHLGEPEVMSTAEADLLPTGGWNVIISDALLHVSSNNIPGIC